MESAPSFLQIPKILETPYIEDQDGIKKPPYLEEIENFKQNQLNVTGILQKR